MKTRQSRLHAVCFSAVLLVGGFLIVYAAFGADSGANNFPIKPGDTINGLRMEAEVRLVEDQDGDELLMIHAFLINEGSHETTVLTHRIGPSMSQDAKGPVIGFDFTGRQERNGRLIIPSLCPYEPVTLRHEEVAMLTARQSSQRFVESLKAGETIRVGYLVTEQWGKRLDLWHGYVCAEVPIVAPRSE